MRSLIFPKRFSSLKLKTAFTLLILTLFADSLSSEIVDNSEVESEIERLVSQNNKTDVIESDPRELEKTEYSSRKFKFKMCCPKGYVLKEGPDEGLTCVPILVTDYLNNSVVTENESLSMREDQISYTVDNSSEVSNFGSHYNLPTCSFGKPRTLNNREGISFYMFPETNEVKVGIEYFVWAAWIPVDQNSYCIGSDERTLKTRAYNLNSSERKLNIKMDMNNKATTGEDVILVFCTLDDYRLTEFMVHRYVYGVSSLATCVPVIITLALFFHVEIHLNPRKWIMISYFISYGCTCAVHGVQMISFANGLEHEATFLCRLYGHLFVYFCSVFGTSCMFVSLDIFWCFWSMNSQLGMKSRPKRGIITTILITWLGPLMLYVGGEIWSLYYDNVLHEFAWKKCLTLNYDTIEFLIMIQFVFKFGVYLSTSLLIFKHVKSTSFATIEAQQDFKSSKTLYAKLFVTTGMPFTCLAIDYCFSYEDTMAWYWFAVRFPHGIIGVYILIVFGLSTEIRRKWRQIHMSPQEKAMEAMKRSNNSDRSDCSHQSNRSFHNIKNNSQSCLVRIVSGKVSKQRSIKPHPEVP